MPPTSSWWALETSLTLAQRGSGRRPCGGRCGGGCAFGGDIVQQPPPQGTRSQECGRSWRKEVRLPRGSKRSCFNGNISAAVVRGGQNRATVPKVPYRPDDETSKRTRMTGGHPHTGDFSQPVLVTRWCNFPTRGRSGDRWSQAGCRQSTLTDRRILALELRIPDHGTRSHKS